MMSYIRKASLNIEAVSGAIAEECGKATVDEAIAYAQVQATLAVAEQLRIANLIALKECLAPTPLGEWVGPGALALDPSEELCRILDLSPDEYPGHGKSSS